MIEPMADDPGLDTNHAVDALDQFLAEAAQHRLLTAAEERALTGRIERGDLKAKDELNTHNLRLVVSIARRCQGSELPRHPPARRHRPVCTDEARSSARALRNQ